MVSRRAYLVLAGLALAWGGVLALALHQPGYTDAYYYFNAAQRLVQGKGLTDPYLWTYLNAPSHLPAPSHTYWMPLESLVAAGSMALLGDSFGAAQLPSVLWWCGLALLAFWLGAHWGRTRRHAWVAGLLIVFSGFYTPFWTTTDTFALYGLVGALGLVAAGLGRMSGNWRWYAVGGLCGGLAHLARADGVLIALVVVLAAIWPGARLKRRQIARAATAALGTYLVVMLPWFIRNLDVLGTPLPTGGTATIWLRGYDELVNYPPDVSAASFWAWGPGHILQSRLVALVNNLGTFVAVETWVILGPFVLLGWRRHYREPFFFAFTVYALGLHLVMTLVFAYPGYRGGLFHSSAALLPFWAWLGLDGLDEAIAWAARRRRWNRKQAQVVFSGALIVLAAVLSLGIVRTRLAAFNHNADFYRELGRDLPQDAVVMVNDPPALYYQTGLSGVVLPNADPDVVVDIAARYGVTYLVVDANRTAPFSGLLLGTDQRPFLRLVRTYGAESADMRRVFEIIPQESPQ